MEALLFVVGIILCFIGICMAFCDADIECFLIGAAIAVAGFFTFQAGLDMGDLKEQLHDTQQQVLSMDNLHKAEVKALEGKLSESQEAAMELAMENQALQLEQNECVDKQKVSQDTLSGIKEILEN